MTKEEFIAEIVIIAAGYRISVPASRKWVARFGHHDPVLVEKFEVAHSAFDALCDYIESRVEKAK